MKNRKTLLNTDFSLIASNCNGAVICNDLNLKFNSPFVNLWMYPSDFIKYLSNIEYYMTCDLRFINENEIAYPVGMLDDIKIYFMHYENEEIARTKWLERTKRINLENIFILMTNRDKCSLEDLKNFDKLPFKNKIVFTRLPYQDIKSSFYIRGFEDQESIGVC